MAETAFPQNHAPAQVAAEPRTIEVVPAVVDALIALGGALLFAAAGALLGADLMLPFDLR